MTQIFVLPLTQAAALGDDAARRFPRRAAKAERLRRPQNKLHCLGAGALLGYALPNVREEQIKQNEHGKPYVPDLRTQFNLSHSGDYIVLAMSDGLVGVDVQRLEPSSGGVAQRCFTEEELRWYQMDDRRFFTLWTLKESVAKALGKGLQLPFNSFSVLPMLDGQSITVQELTLYGQAQLLPGHALAVCSTEPFDKIIEPVMLTAEEIKRKL